MDIKRSQHKHFIVFMLVVLSSTPIAGDGFQASYNFSVNVIEQEGGILRQLLEQMKDLTEKVHDQAQENAFLRKGMIQRFEKMDLKIEWAITDGTLAPKNVSGILQIFQHNQAQLSVLQNDVQETKEMVEHLHSRHILGVVLVGGPSRLKGRLMITHLGQQIGTVCDDYFDEKDAKVVCRMLGYRGSTVRFGRFYGPGSGPIFLDNVECTGNERLLFDCESRPWGEHNCGHSEDVSIKCGF